MATERDFFVEHARKLWSVAEELDAFRQALPREQSQAAAWIAQIAARLKAQGEDLNAEIDKPDPGSLEAIAALGSRRARYAKAALRWALVASSAGIVGNRADALLPNLIEGIQTVVEHSQHFATYVIESGQGTAAAMAAIAAGSAIFGPDGDPLPQESEATQSSGDGQIAAEEYAHNSGTEVGAETPPQHPTPSEPTLDEGEAFTANEGEALTTGNGQPAPATTAADGGGRPPWSISAERRRRSGDRLKAEREAASLSLQALALRVGVDTSTLGRWESGTFLPVEHMQRKLGEALSVDPRRIFNDY